MEIEEMLERTPIFSELTQRDLRSLAGTARIRKYQRGDVIVEEGGGAAGCFIIASGNVEVVRGADTASPSVLAKLGPGEFFGEMAILDDHPRSATVRATEDTECVTITRWDFRAEMRNRPDIAIQMLPVLIRRLRAAEAKPTE